MKTNSDELTPLGGRTAFWIAFWLLVALLVGTSAAVAQSPEPHTKLDVRLKMLTSRALSADRGARALAGSGGETIDLFVSGDVSRIRDVVAASGGIVRSVSGDLVVATVPMRAVGTLAASGAVTRLASTSEVTTHNDLAAESVRADKVRTAPPAGQSSYTGKGVIVGVIDTGIDWTHPDFRDPDDTTRTRILTIWDHKDSLGTPPTGFDYGTVWSRQQIDDALASGDWGRVRHVDSNGHGTHVTGTAAGNGLALGRHRGIAPEADIAVVAVRMRTSYIADAARYLVDYAAALGRPIVLNLSLGAENDPRDGTAPLDLALDAILNEGPGRVAVIAAGNSGAERAHAGATLSPTPSWTYAMYDTTSLQTPRDGALTIVANGKVRTSDAASLSIAVAVDSLLLDGERVTPVAGGTSAWMTIAELAAREEPVEGRLVYASGAEAATYVVTAVRNHEGEYDWYMLIRDQVTEAYDREVSAFGAGVDYFRVMFKGDGAAHLWAGYMLPINPGDRGFDGAPGYMSWSNGYTVTSPATSHASIAVGAYSNHGHYRNLEGTDVLYPRAQREGEIAYFSSAGPSTDGRIKPEITAPGHGVISALTRVNLNNPERRDRVVEGARHIIYSGTSMASPVVAGAVALYLERNPTADWRRVKEAITSTARTDEHTAGNGPLPNGTWGYGKLDIYRAIYDGASAAPGEEASGLSIGAVTPTPATNAATVAFSVATRSNVRLEVVDMTGIVREVLADRTLDADRYEAEIDVASLAPGLYLCRLSADGRTLTHPLVVAR